MKKSLLGLVLAVACSTVLAGPPSDPSESTDGRSLPLWNSGLSLAPGNCTNRTESTGFETGGPDGWDSCALFGPRQICGIGALGTFVAYGDDADCVPGPTQAASCLVLPGATENCCGDYPQPVNCWFTSSVSQSCTQPQIACVNPKTGDQHLRLQVDPVEAGNGSGSTQAFTPLNNDVVAMAGAYGTSMEFDLNGSAAGSSQLRFRMFGVGDGNAGVMWFEKGTTGTSDMYVTDLNLPSAAQKHFTGYWVPGVYRKVKIVRNPCRSPEWNGVPGMTQVYYYENAAGALVEIYRHATTPYIANVLRTNWLYIPPATTDVKTYDVDNYVIERGPQCTSVCGDGFVDAPETCEPSVPGGCKPGHTCNAVGTAGQCTCDRICTFDVPCNLNKGPNGPYYGPMDGSGYGVFLFEADAGSTSISTCDTTGYDTKIFYWGSWNDVNDPGTSNDDCCNNIPSNGDCFGYGQDADPSASCYSAGGDPSPYPACTCWDLPDPLDTTFGAVINAPAGSQKLVVNITNKGTCGVPILGGACCDAEGSPGSTVGNCTDGANVTAASCAAIGPQTTFHLNKSCDIISCVRHTGACCDLNPNVTHCTIGYPEDCDYKGDLIWIKGASCDPNPCGEVVLGACCNTKTALCLDNQVAGECRGQWDVFTLDATCDKTDCNPDPGACCDHDTFGGCTYTSQALCDCPKCEWIKGKFCEDVCTLHDAIPTVSEWGIVVLTLLLLVGAKVYFGRRQSATA